MRTEAQDEASRENGAKSQGPTTDAGKAKSSQNAIKLGLFSRCVVLANESQEFYDQLLERYRAEWNPKGQSENDMLIEMVNARWRLRRIWSWETAAIDTEMFMQRPGFDASFSTHHPGMRAADAFLALTAQNPAAITSLLRAETTYSRAYRRAQDGLIKLQSLRGCKVQNKAENVVETPPVRNEPEPKPAAEPKPQSLLQFLLAIILMLSSMLTQAAATPRQRAERPAIERHLDPNLTPEPESTSQQPETFHWESVFTPTKQRPTTDSRDWLHPQ